MQRREGGSIYLRLSTRACEQPERTLSAGQQADIVAGGYWCAAPEPGADLAIVCMGAVAPEAIAAHDASPSDFAGAGLLVVTSPDRLHADWLAAQRNRGRTAGAVDRSAGAGRAAAGAAVARRALVTVIDGHPLALSLAGRRARPARRAARRRPFRPVRRHPRPLPRLRARRGGNRRRRGALDR